MCGRYRRKSDKQKIAEAFRASVGLDLMMASARVWKVRTYNPDIKPDRVWIAPCVDGIWTGSEWVLYTGLPEIHKPLIYPEQTKASVRLTALFESKFDDYGELEPLTIADQELNAAYDAHLTDPEAEEREPLGYDCCLCAEFR